MRIFIFLIFCASTVFGTEFFTGTENFRMAHIGIYIVDVETGEELYAHNSEQFFVLASLQKIITSAAALALLGEDYCFKTDLEYEGRIDRKGILHGNVLVRGGGDPTLSLDIFPRWEEALKKEGIHKIDGKVLVDTSCFENALASPYWLFQDLGNYFGAGASALTVHQNLYRITFQPGKKEGDPAKVVKIDPEIPNLVYHNEVTTGPARSGDQVYIYGMEYSPVQFYRGTVPLDKPAFTVKASIPDPARFCAEALCSRVPASEGIEVGRTEREYKLINRTESPPLKEMLQLMNKQSVNLYAEHLLKAMGNGTSADGAVKMGHFLKKRNIPSQVRDGSGLSRTNYITPKGFAILLREIRTSPLYQSLYASFPEIAEGTLESFPEISKASLKAKTGSMSDVYNLGGYLTLDSGKEYAFCICCNHYLGPSSKIKAEMHRFLAYFAKSTEKN